MYRKQKSRRRRTKAGQMKRGAIIIATVLAVSVVGVTGYFYLNNRIAAPGTEAAEQLPQTPEELLLAYMSSIEQGQYEHMYEMLNSQSKRNITSEEFITRNQNIYQGIEAADIQVTVTGTEDNGDQTITVSYDTTIQTLAGEISFPNYAVFMDSALEQEEMPYPYVLIWNDSIIFPNLSASDRVRVINTKAERGEIVDRNGTLLAGKGMASSVGIVPGRMGFASDPAADDSAASAHIETLAGLLGVSPDSIRRSLSAGWVKADSFVPVKTIEKLTDLERTATVSDDRIIEKMNLEEALLAIPGVMITDTEIRNYPLGQAAAHLVGYIQPVTAEDLEKHAGEGYQTDSVIGRSGMEVLYETELKGQNGCKITIINSEGDEKLTLAEIPKQDGQTIRLTIDASLQQSIYNAYAEDKSSSVAMNPYTGEVLALVSTPSYDSRDFIYGMSQALWDNLNNDERLPLYNRFRQTLSPGSSFKPITAAIGLETGAIDPDTDYGDEGLSWQKDGSWGNYFVTTLHNYRPVILENAMIYSDNIYFAKSALRIGSERLEQELDKLGFNQPLPFEITLAPSQYANADHISSEIQLADSGYGQGEILVNPIHLAALYTGFANGGDVLKPYLRYQDTPASEVWLEQAYTPETAERVKHTMEQVIINPNGTGHRAYRDTPTLAGKTGTAEIKQSQTDTTGTELGWFNVFTTQTDTTKPLLLVTMVEDVKGRGGSGYVVGKTTPVLDEYFRGE